MIVKDLKKQLDNCNEDSIVVIYYNQEVIPINNLEIKSHSVFINGEDYDD